MTHSPELPETALRRCGNQN